MENKVILRSPTVTKKKKKVKMTYKEETIESLISEAKHAILQLQSLRKYYQFVTDEELIEYAIYREKAEKERISYLIKKIKEIKYA